MIQSMDVDQPQVVIQVLIAEVRLDGSEEFGVELGLQSPVLFQRGITPLSSLLGSGSVTYTSATGGIVPAGVTVNTSINPTAQPSYQFNNPAAALSTHPAANTGIAGLQCLRRLRRRRASA